MSSTVTGTAPLVLLTFGLKPEARVLLRRAQAESRSEFLYLGKIKHLSVAIFFVGIGAPRTAGLISVLRRYQPALVVSSGFAGAVGPGLRAGAFVLATNFTALAWPAAQDRLLPFDAVGEFRQVDSVLGPAAKVELGACGLQAVDMESETVAKICAAEGVSILTARMISDAADERIPGVFLGKRPNGPAEALAAGRFAFRMLRLTSSLADRLSELVLALPLEKRPEWNGIDVLR